MPGFIRFGEANKLENIPYGEGKQPISSIGIRKLRTPGAGLAESGRNKYDRIKII